jgi:hypothetical protein
VAARVERGDQWGEAPRWATILILLIAAAAFALRVQALLRQGGVLAAVVDYDEGVYYSAAALLARGHLPYRDFVLAHPPGSAYLLAPLAAVFDPRQGFEVARVAMCLVGAVNVGLIGRITLMQLGPAAAIAAALVYATYPEAVSSEHGVFLEPLLALALLAAAACWFGLVRPRPRPTPVSVFAAGVLSGVALAIKLWAGFAIAAFLLSLPRAGGMRLALRYVAGLAVATVVLCGPMLAVAGIDFPRQVLRFQLERPPDGIVSLPARGGQILFHQHGVAEFFASSHLAATALALLGLAAVVIDPRPLGRFATLWFVFTIAGFLVSVSYFPRYSAALAPSSALLGAIAVSWVADAAHARQRLIRRTSVATVAVLLALPLLRLPWTAREVALQSATLPAVGHSIDEHVPPNACIVSFEPQWLLAAGRLPGVGGANRFGVDPYAAMLLEQIARSPGDYTSAAAAFRAQPFDTEMRRAIASCDYVVLGWLGRRQLTSAQLRWFHQRYRRLSGTLSVDLWRSRIHLTP